MPNPSLRVFLYLFLSTIILFSACEDSTTVGGDIFGPEDLEVLFSDDTELIATTVRLDSIKTYDNTDEAVSCLLNSLPIRNWQAGALPTHYLGSVDDPKFGKSKSSIYTEVGFATTPVFNGTIDSMVLVLAYDTIAFHGNKFESFDVEVYRVLERFTAIGDAAYTGTELLLSDEPIASREDIFYSLDSLNVSIPGVDSSVLQAPSIRIPFDPSNIMGSLLPIEIFQSEDAFTDTESFKNLLNGLYITTASSGNSMPGIRMNSSSIEMYYKDDDGDRTIYQFGLFNTNLISFNHIESDRASSVAGQAAASGNSPDNLIYVSGQDGFDTHIDFSDVDRFQNFTLNKAVLEFTVQEPTGTESGFFKPSPSLIVSQLGDNNELICIEDMSLGFPSTFVGSLFGGDLEEVDESGTVLRKYTMNITSHVQNYLNGSVSPTLVLSVDNRTDNASRTVLFGPNHPTNPAKLMLTYTAP